jgi:phage shock protein PspC (stress-responsive transcriptional regulator)
MKFVRAQDGMIFGVCKGLARTLGLSTGWLRVAVIASVLFFGFGLYLMLAISFPREDRQAQALEPWILGVCTRLAARTEVEVGLLRFVAVCLAVLSMGATLIGYLVLHFVVEKPTYPSNSASNPSSPPSTI